MTLTENDKKILLQIARSVIMALPGEAQLNRELVQGANLQLHCGAFVTLKRQGQLRGCIGSFISERPLWQEIAVLARSSATRDPRFLPLRDEEKGEISLEISVLSPLQTIRSIEEIEIGRHGLLIEQGFHRGVLLPQVATEYGWDRKTFLEQTCIKAGLPPDAWRDGTTRLQTFSAQVFGEE